MGSVKDDWMAAQDRGWCEVEKLACADCVNQAELWRIASGLEKLGMCDYCEAEEKSVLPVSAIQEALYSVMSAYYAEPARAGTPSDDGSYIVEPIFTEEVLGNLGFDPTPELLDDIVDADYVDAWVSAAEGHWAGSHEHQVKLGSWTSFAHVVKHQTRFHFQRVTDDNHLYEIGVSDILEVIAEELKTLVRTIDAGAEIYRARHLTDAERESMNGESMGAPPKELASAGRMNPAGIPYFYASCAAQTALLEIGTPPVGKTAAVASFVSQCPLRVVDLTQLPTEPSIFAIDMKDLREKSRFLRGFVDSITQPVTKDGREHIDYVPSQVVCEYLAQAVSLDDGKPLDGLLFPSAVHAGGVNLVVFPTGKWFEPKRFSSLEFVGPA